MLRSPFENDLLRRLTLSIDYYSIDLDGAIDVPTGTQVYQQCLSGEFQPADARRRARTRVRRSQAANPYCDLILREYTAQFPTGADRRYRASYVNLGGIKTDGFDVQLDWVRRSGRSPACSR